MEEAASELTQGGQDRWDLDREGEASLTRQWLELRHEGRGEIRLMCSNKEAEIKKRLQVNL